MPQNRTAFWTAFWAGMAAPTMMYAPPPPYGAYMPTLGPAESFAVSGAYLRQALGRFGDGTRGASATQPNGSDAT